MFASRRQTQHEIERWASIGLIDAATARRLRDDVELRARPFRLTAALAMMSAALLGASLLIFIAANWEEIPRLVRCALLGASLLGGYVGGAVLMGRDRPGAAEAFWAFATVAFGASTALIGQMYHLSGDAADAMLAWVAAALLAAVLLRSRAATMIAAGLVIAWLSIDFAGSLSPAQTASYPMLAALVWATSLWTDTRGARHLLLLGLAVFVALLYDGDAAAVLVVAMALAALLFVVAVLWPAAVEKVLRLDGRSALHALLHFLFAGALLQFEWHRPPHLAYVAAVILLCLVAALLLAGRQSRTVRFTIYAAFAIELVWLYLQMLGTMLGTAGFLLAAGLALAAFAGLVTWLERRMAPAEPEGAR